MKKWILVWVLLLVVSVQAQMAGNYLGQYGTASTDTVFIPVFNVDSTIALTPVDAETIQIFIKRKDNGARWTLIDSSLIHSGSTPTLASTKVRTGSYEVPRTTNGATQGFYWAEVTSWEFINSKRIYSYGSATWQITGSNNEMRIVSTESTTTVMGTVATVTDLADSAIDAASIKSNSITEPKIAASAIGVSEAPNLDAAVSSRLAPTVAARTLDVTATGEAGLDWANIGSPTTVQGLSGTTIKAVTDPVTTTNDSKISDLWKSLIQKKAVTTTGTHTTTKFISTDLTEADDYWNDNFGVFITGNAKGQAFYIKDFFTTGDSAQVQLPLTTAPATGDSFIIFGIGDLGATIAEMVDSIWREDTTGYRAVTNSFGKWILGLSAGTSNWSDAQRDSVLAALTNTAIRIKVWSALLASYGIKGSAGHVLNLISQNATREFGNFIFNGILEIDSITDLGTGWSARYQTANANRRVDTQYTAGGKNSYRLTATGSAADSVWVYTRWFYLPANTWLIWGFNSYDREVGAGSHIVRAYVTNRSFTISDSIDIPSFSLNGASYAFTKLYNNTADKEVQLNFKISKSAVSGNDSLFIDNVFAYIVPDTLNQVIAASTDTSGTAREVWRQLIASTWPAGSFGKLFQDSANYWGRIGGAASVNYDSIAKYVWQYQGTVTLFDTIPKVFAVNTSGITGSYKLKLLARDSTGAVNLGGILVQIRKKGTGIFSSIYQTGDNGTVQFDVTSDTFEIFGFGIGYTHTSPAWTVVGTADLTDTIYFSAFIPMAPTFAYGNILYGCVTWPDGFAPPAGEQITVDFDDSAGVWTTRPMCLQDASDTTKFIFIKNVFKTKGIPIKKDHTWQVEVPWSSKIYWHNPDGTHTLANPVYKFKIPGIGGSNTFIRVRALSQAAQRVQ